MQPESYKWGLKYWYSLQMEEVNWQRKEKPLFFSLRFEAFTANKCAEIFSAISRMNDTLKSQRFRDVLGLHHQSWCGEWPYFTNFCKYLLSFTESTLMLEAEEISETLAFNSTLTLLIAREHFTTYFYLFYIYIYIYTAIDASEESLLTVRNSVIWPTIKWFSEVLCQWSILCDSIVLAVGPCPLCETSLMYATFRDMASCDWLTYGQIILNCLF
jgi:hypothetical protein